MSSSLMIALDRQDKSETARILSTMPSEVSIKDAEDRVALHYAAETMDLETFIAIYDQDPTLVDCQDRNGHTPLLVAVMGGRTDLVEFLLEKGANIRHVDKEGHSVVHWAVVCGQLDTLNFLLEKGADPASPDLMKAHPLHYATATEEISHDTAISVLHILLRKGAPANSLDIDERTPILWASSNGNVEAIQSLRQAGGDIQAVDRDRLGALHCAASHGFHEVIELVLSCVPRSLVDSKDRSGHTPLFYAVSHGHFEAARILLAAGANPNHQDNRLRTPAHCASAKGQLRILKLLKQFGASFEIQNYRGDLPLHEAVQAGSKEVVEWLLALHPSSLDASSHEGRRALHLAAATGNIELVVFLCNHKPQINPVMLFRGNLYTPLDLAHRKDHQVVVDYLTMRHDAKRAADIPEEERNKYKMQYEESIVNAKLARGKILRNESVSSDDAHHHRRKVRRRRTSSEMIIKSTQTNTPKKIEHRASSANSSGRMGMKATSTTDLHEAQVETIADKYDKRIEQILRAEISKAMEQEQDVEEAVAVRKASKKESPKKSAPEHEIDEALLGKSISDTSDAEDDESTDRDSKENSEPNGATQQPSLKNKASASNKKAVRITNDAKNGEDSDKYEKREGKHLMRVRREPEIGNDAGDYDIFEDDWEQIDAERPAGKEARRRYVHEKAIFQELTHLKRMQIQYGKVQEKVLVRSLVGNFCKMHGLNPADFKFYTFYAWEKFLYDALSDQLKMIYMEERERLVTAGGAMRHHHAGSQSHRLGKFETRLRQARAVPLNDKIRELNRVYGPGTMTAGAKSPLRRATVDGDKASSCSGKRCECLGRHLLIQNDKDAKPNWNY